MSGFVEGVVGEATTLELQLSDRATTLFPQALVVNSAGATVFTVNLAAVAGKPGLYQNTYTPTLAGMFTAQYTVYTDAGHTIVSTSYTTESQDIRIWNLNQDTALTVLLGDGGSNVRDDVLTYDTNNRPLTFRRRVFPNAATAAASTPGATGEGAILTIEGFAAYYSADQWQTLLRVVVP